MRINKQGRAGPIMVGLMFMGLTFVGLIARAQGLPCDPVIVDDASVFGSLSRLQEAAGSLERSGAIVRIRTVRTYGSFGSINHLQQAMRQQCASWQAPNGENRDNLVAIILGVDDHEVGIYTGRQWTRTITDEATRDIQTEIMAPRFRSGDFPGAFIAAMDEIGRLIDAARPSARVASPVLPVGGGVVIVQQPASAPESCGNVGLGFLVLLVLVLLVAAIVMVRNANQRRRAAQANARDKRHAATSGLLEVRGKLPGLKTRMEATALALTETDAQVLRGKFQGIERLIGTMAVTLAEVEPEGSQDPTRDGRSREEYETIAKGYQRALDQLREIQAGVQAHDQELDALHKAAREAPRAVEAAETTIGHAAGAIDSARVQGWKVAEAAALLESARRHYLTAGELSGAKRLANAKREADQAVGEADEAKRAVGALPQRRASIDASTEQLEARIGEVAGRIGDGRAAFERITGRYAESSWDDIAGNGSQAETAIASAREALTVGRAAATMAEQRWEDAEAAVKNGNAALDRAQSLIEAIVALENRLQAAEKSARAEIDAAATDLERAAAYEHQHDADIDDAMKVEIARARTTLERAKAEFAKAKPDFLAVVKLAQEANAHADRILAKCQSEHEAAQRLRQRAASTVRDAESAIARARGYIRGRSSDVESGARGLLQSAEATLARARATNDAQAKLADAQHAKSEADSAYQQARRDVEAADDDGADGLAAFATGVAIGSIASGGSRSGYGGGSYGGGGGGGESHGSSTSWGDGGGGESHGSSTKW